MSSGAIYPVIKTFTFVNFFVHTDISHRIVCLHNENRISSLDVIYKGKEKHAFVCVCVTAWCIKLSVFTYDSLTELRYCCGNAWTFLRIQMVPVSLDVNLRLHAQRFKLHLFRCRIIDLYCLCQQMCSLFLCMEYYAVFDTLKEEIKGEVFWSRSGMTR